MVMPPAAAVCGIMSWEEEEEEGAWLAIVEGGREGSGRRRRWERRTTEVDGELVVNHVIRRKEALIRLFDLHTYSFLPSSSTSTGELSNERFVVDLRCAFHFGVSKLKNSSLSLALEFRSDVIPRLKNQEKIY